MTYGHAERTLAAIRHLEAETEELLSGLDHLDPEQERWLGDTGAPARRESVHAPALSSRRI